MRTLAVPTVPFASLLRPVPTSKYLPIYLAYWLFTLLLGTAPVAGQNRYTSTNKKAIGYYEEAQNLLRYRQVGKARQLFEKAIDKDSTFLEAHRSLGRDRPHHGR